MTLPADTASRCDIACVISTHGCRWPRGLLCGVKRGSPALKEQPRSVLRLPLPVICCISVLHRKFAARLDPGMVWWATPGREGVLRSNPPSGRGQPLADPALGYLCSVMARLIRLMSLDLKSPDSFASFISRGSHTCISHPITCAGREEPRTFCGSISREVQSWVTHSSLSLVWRICKPTSRACLHLIFTKCQLAKDLLAYFIFVLRGNQVHPEPGKSHRRGQMLHLPAEIPCGRTPWSCRWEPKHSVRVPGAGTATRGQQPVLGGVQGGRNSLVHRARCSAFMAVPAGPSTAALWKQQFGEYSHGCEHHPSVSPYQSRNGAALETLQAQDSHSSLGSAAPWHGTTETNKPLIGPHVISWLRREQFTHYSSFEVWKHPRLVKLPSGLQGKLAKGQFPVVWGLCSTEFSRLSWTSAISKPSG